jgi:Nucleotidyl transferase AbiEii toxin, Type IV TA system
MSTETETEAKTEADAETETWDRFGWRSKQLPRSPLSDELRDELNLPHTLRPIPDASVNQDPVFDPALKQFPHAYRAGDPQFADDEDARRWRAARQAATEAVLAAISGSPYADSLVLRGSVLLRAWYGSDAREPGDLDFVVVPQDWNLDDPRTPQMLDAIALGAEERCVERGVSILASGAVSDEIWTYDRVPGRRLMLPWRAPGLPGGWVQLDFVFNELLPTEPQDTVIPVADGGPGIRMSAATPEQSLAWKLLWLITDMHPQGKDLYDAVLLAERTSLRYEVLRDTFVPAVPYRHTVPLRANDLAEFATEWEHFEAEYPDRPGTVDEYQQRLTAALAPLLADLEGNGAGAYELYRRWLGPDITRYRALLEGTDMSTVQQTMIHERVSVQAAVVVTRELLGAPATVEDAHRRVVGDPAWALPMAAHDGDADLRPHLASFGVDVTDSALPLAPETRLIRRIRADFDFWRALRWVAELPLHSADPALHTERAQAAVVLAARGDQDALLRMAMLAQSDLPAVLAAAGLDGADWAERLDAELGAPTG